MIGHCGSQRMFTLDAALSWLRNPSLLHLHSHRCAGLSFAQVHQARWKPKFDVFRAALTNWCEISLLRWRVNQRSTSWSGLQSSAPIHRRGSDWTFHGVYGFVWKEQTFQISCFILKPVARVKLYRLVPASIVISRDSTLRCWRLLNHGLWCCALLRQMYDLLHRYNSLSSFDADAHACYAPY